jgi:hypothetical protein
MPASDSPRLRLYADRDGHGRIRTTYLVCADGDLAIATADSDDLPPQTIAPVLHPVGPVSHVALRVVFERYGRPLSPDVDAAAHAVREQPDDQPLVVSIAEGVEATLSRFRYKPFGWVYPADYLLFSPGTGEPLAAEAPLICSALSALAKSAGARAAKSG